MKKLLLIILVFLISASIFAQRTVKVEAEYTYVVPENTTIEQAKMTAIDRAKIQAIADEFGTIVNQSNLTYIENDGNSSSITFQSLGGSDVKGEWIETIDEPAFDIGYEQNMLVVKVKVKGRIREIKNSHVDLIVQILCNGTEPKYERSDFKNGDDLYLRFQSPVDGHLAVYLVDYSAKTAYCMLPYSQSSDNTQSIQKDREYIFFSAKDAPDIFRDEVDEYVLTCSSGIERNDLYVIFSPNDFVKANSQKTEESLPRELSIAEFNEWLTRIRKSDNQIQIHNQLLTIKN